MSMAAPVSPPLLHDGDRLTSDEFLRRWEAMPDLKHAELIDGIVCMPSPVSLDHSDFHVTLCGWISLYTADTPGCRAGSDGTWLMSKREVPQPDIALRILPEFGGQSRVEGGYAAGAPELIVEVAASSRARDLGVKLRLYERMGVREYLVAVVGAEQVLWKELSAGSFRPLDADSDGILRSRCFPGLWLEPAALWRRDQTRLFAVLEEGLASREHSEFVASFAG